MEKILAKIKEYPLIPVYYNDDLETCKKTVKACYEGGIRVFEFVNRGANALANFKKLVEFRNENFSDLTLAIGTIKTGKQAVEFIEAGADLIVSPIVNSDIAQVTREKNILWIPGAMTPTEVALCEELQAPLVKLFPGDLLGIPFVKAIRPLFPNLMFMPTGGVQLNEENITEWFRSGVISIGMGSKLFDGLNDDETLLKERVQQVFKWIQAAKK